MNKQRRKELDKAIKTIEEAQSIIQFCIDEEQEYFDNMPESFQDGEKGNRAEEVISDLDQATEELTGTIELIQGAQEQ